MVVKLMAIKEDIKQLKNKEIEYNQIKIKGFRFVLI